MGHTSLIPKIMEEIGYVKAKVESIDDRLNKQNGALLTLQKTVNRHDVIFGKIGVVTAGVAFVVSTTFVLITDFIRDRLR